MRLRRLVVASLATTFGIAMLIFAYPSAQQIRAHKNLMANFARLNNATRKAGEPRPKSYISSFALDPNKKILTTGFIALGVAGGAL